MFSYVNLETRIPPDHPLRAMKALVEPVLRELSPRFEALYAEGGRPSIPPEQLLRALLLQVLYTVRSERQLMEQLDYNLLFRWFVGLAMDEAVWHPTTFTKNRDRLLAGNIAEAFLTAVVRVADRKRLLSKEHSRSTARCSRRRRAKRASGGGTLWHRGTAFVDWIFTFTMAAYNLVRVRTLLRAGVAR